MKTTLVLFLIAFISITNCKVTRDPSRNISPNQSEGTTIKSKEENNSINEKSPADISDPSQNPFSDPVNDFTDGLGNDLKKEQTILNEDNINILVDDLWIEVLDFIEVSVKDVMTITVNDLHISEATYIRGTYFNFFGI